MIIILFYAFIGFILNYFGMPWWLIFVIFGIDYLLPKWNRSRRSRTISSDQGLQGLIALLKIRSAETGAIYHVTRRYQRQAEDKSWIPLFIAEYRAESNDSIYQEPCKKRDRKYREQALALSGKRFSLEPFFGRLNERALRDIGAAMLFWATNPSRTIELLKSITCDAKLSNHVCTLLRHYKLLMLFTLNGSYSILFKNWFPFSGLARWQYRQLCMHWREVLWSCRDSVVIAEATGCFGQTPGSFDEIWKEIEILLEMESNLDSALSQENIHSFRWKRDNEEEAVFFQHLTNSSIWKRYYGCEFQFDQNGSVSV